MGSNDEPLTHHTARAPLLRAICSWAECEPVKGTVLAGAGAVATVLRDQRRFSVLGGRADMRRSLGSVHAMNVLLFLGSGFRGAIQRTVHVQSTWSYSFGFAVTHCGSVALVGTGCEVVACRVAEGAVLQRADTNDTGPLFDDSRQIWIAPDGAVYVAEWGGTRVQVLTPQLDAWQVIDLEHRPRGVCADEALAFVSERNGDRIAVFSRGAAAHTLLRYITGVKNPTELCLVPSAGLVAVISSGNEPGAQVQLFTPEGVLVRCITLQYPTAMACSACGELVVVDCFERIVVFDCDGRAAKTILVPVIDTGTDWGKMGAIPYQSVAVRGRTIFAHTNRGQIHVIA